MYISHICVMYVLSDKVLVVNYKWVDINVDDYRSEIAKLYNRRS